MTIDPSLSEKMFKKKEGWFFDAHSVWRSLVDLLGRVKSNSHQAKTLLLESRYLVGDVVVLEKEQLGGEER